MALFQKKPVVGTSAPLYTLGLQKTVLLVGLGNVGKEYAGTRHNIGFEILDVFASKQGLDNWMDKKDLKCQLATGNIADSRVILCKPTTMMNLSGEAVQAVARFYKVEPAAMVVVHDELDIGFGQIRTRLGGSDAGHNGVKSLIQHLGADFGRIRIGVGPKTPEKMESADFVLAKFSDKEQAQLKNLTQEAIAILTEYVHSAQLPAETRTFLV
ncbi:MAG TPA: aminoacyl-tRNA hydrolase [Candidatus Saccharimonadales bacterium]|nr:aminoacyl-tRNA hydrolase [Candidatus Saccharimonadales bacterium]